MNEIMLTQPQEETDVSESEKTVRPQKLPCSVASHRRDVGPLAQSFAAPYYSKSVLGLPWQSSG